ncbi:class III poly(R)-hydroxyalkanoic acid synthase subunit PhaC [Rubrobacter taiwanensis]|jgi:polyhydroxyalkanoate synthase|uniref:Poly(3-hydroxyalkanoate) polymerase subunit PhaC n=1 Tax=Rubrobacter taiwanensis TaxID=185139 RepID=A0A4R1BG55_9ACTN|nr:class III poly(R)-hydroxyalkanoic acid synthase subunit PhaC [Rubrobacter taiwanensis]TCJ16171.1 class III poly(R)-hydroxyalkanoic acid synthase subunit PhaC [Rubrobacter taiwanensis]
MIEPQSIIPGDFDDFLDKYRQGMKIVLEGARAETGQTPKEVVWTKNKAKLYRYQPYAEKRHRVPLLIVYALINRPYVLDLLPGNSFIEYLTDEGFDVYMLDWGIPGDEDAGLSFEHYVMDYMRRAAHKVMRTSGTEEFSLLGYCMGGTMSAMYAALFPERLRNLILLTAPVDFATEHIGLYRLFTGEKYMDVADFVDAFGNIPGEMIDTGNRMLKPVTNYIGTYVTMWDRIMQDKPMETWLAMNKWVNDGPPFPGEAFKMWIRDFYQQNKLVKGEIRLRGRRVDLSNIRCPFLSIAGKKDHICTIPQAEAAMDLISSEDKEFFVLDAGHVGLMTGRGAKKGLWPKVSGWLGPRSK